MAGLVSLADIKKHLNIPETFTDDDEYLTELEEMAEELVAFMLDTNSVIGMWDLAAYFTDPDDPSAYVVLPKCIVHAIKIIVADYYINRTSISAISLHDVPRSATHLVNQWKNYGI